MNKLYHKNINKHVSKLKSNGYLVIEKLLSEKKCDFLKSELKKIYKKFIKKKYY